MFSIDNTRLLFFIVTIISLKLYIDHRETDYSGDYMINGEYDNMSPIKHDLIKFLIIGLAFLLVYGTSMGIGPTPFYDKDDILQSWIGKIVVLLSSIVIFYELVEPYVLNKVKFI